MVPDIFGCCNSALTLFVPLSRRGFFCSNLVRTNRLVDGGNLGLSIIHSVKIHPAPDNERKKLCVRVVRKALPMIEIN